MHLLSSRMSLPEEISRSIYDRIRLTVVWRGDSQKAQLTHVKIIYRPTDKHS